MHRWTNCLMACIATVAGLQTLSVQASEREFEAVWRLQNFDQPESVIAEASQKNVYVSNINGSPVELNGKGYISKLTSDGKLINKHWLGGLDAPKGMGIDGDLLYIADMQRVVVVSLSQAKIVQQYYVENAKMLNDITISNKGTVYISDLLGGGIYRIKQNKIMLWLSSEKIPYPNGLSWHDGKLYVASWGKGINADFTTQTLGGIYHIDEENPEAGLTETVSALGNLDGIAWIDDRLYVSDWITGVLYKIDHGVREPVLTLAPGLADIGSEGRLLFTPMMHQGEVTAWRL